MRSERPCVLALAAALVASAVAPAQAAARPKRTAPVEAAPVEPAPEMPAAVDPALAAAQELYSRGLTHYETLDYDLAISSWKDALEKLRAAEVDTPEQARSVASARTAIVYNIARAQQRAFGQDHDVARLKKAKGLLELYVRESTEAGTVDESELAVARSRIDEIAEQIVEAERPRPLEPPAPAPAPAPKDDGRKPGVGLIAGGATALVLGVGAVVGGAVIGTRMSGGSESDLADLDQLGDEPARRDALARGRTGDTVLIASTVAGGLVAVAGVVLLAIGAKRAKAPRRAPVASFGAGFVMFGVAGRF